MYVCVGGTKTWLGKLKEGFNHSENICFTRVIDKFFLEGNEDHVYRPYYGII